MTDNTDRFPHDQDADLVDGEVAVQSLRSAGYQTTEKALAEIIDNSFEALADNVVVLIVERRGYRTEESRRETRIIEDIYVIDDGKGMDPATLRRSIRFGGGDRQNREGMGRFGFGLPQSSISQCLRTDLWSWQGGRPNAHHTCLDLKWAEKNGIRNPPPEGPVADGNDPGLETALPNRGVKFPRFLIDHALAPEVLGKAAGSGTIVRWSQFDNLTWLRPDTVADKVSRFFGRTYRRFLGDDTPLVGYSSPSAPDVEDAMSGLLLSRWQELCDSEEAADLSGGKKTKNRNLTIRIVTRDTPDEPELLDEVRYHIDDEWDVKPNDPLYLMPAEETHLGWWATTEEEEEGKNPRHDAPFMTRATYERVVFVKASEREGHYHPVRIRGSLVKPEARYRPQAGRTTHLGRHAKTNQGISIMRAGRELQMTDRMFTEARDRYMSLEVEFPPALDKEFGVANNKQAADQFVSALQLVEQESGKTRRELVNDGLLAPGTVQWSVYPVARVAKVIRDALNDVVGGQKEGERSTGSAEPGAASNASTTDRENAPEEKTAGEQEAETRKTPPTEDEVDAAVDDIINQTPGARETMTDDDVRRIKQAVHSGLAYVFLPASDPESSAFFSVGETTGGAEQRGSLKFVRVNTTHPLWSQYLDAARGTNERINNMGVTEARETLKKARDGLAWMLISWLRFELNPNNPMRDSFPRLREDWGARLRDYIENADSEEMLQGSPVDATLGGQKPSKLLDLGIDLD